MVALDWTEADLRAWEEEQRRKKEEEEKRLREEEAALLGTTAPVYGSPQLAPPKPYEAPAPQAPRAPEAPRPVPSA